jgi:hypothetical protein
MPDIGERRLATIRRISALEPIEGADKIVKAVIDGWELVTQKDNYKVGDLALYFEIDSFLPVREEFEFLRKGCFKSTTNLGDGFRIKTIKLRGQVSQGLSLPLSDFFQQEDGRYYYLDGSTTIWIEEGLDVTDYFKVQKYEKPIPSGKGSSMGPMHAKGSYPSFVPKTDQERVQNCLGGIKKWIYFNNPTVTEVVHPEHLELLEAGKVENNEATQYFKSGDQWFQRNALYNTPEVIITRQVFEATLKLDGSSMTVYHNDGTYGVCSRNWELKRDIENVFWKTAMSTGVLLALMDLGLNYAIQGELMGPGVQGNREELPDHKFFVFDIYDIDQGRYLLPAERHRVMSQLRAHLAVNEDAFDHAPLIGDGMFGVTHDMTVGDFLKMAEIKSIKHPIAEGIVFKSTEVGGPSFKVISNTFLLKEKD